MVIKGVSIDLSEIFKKFKFFFYLGGTGITADHGKNSYLFNRHFENCQNSYDPPPSDISSIYDIIACKYYK